MPDPAHHHTELPEVRQLKIVYVVLFVIGVVCILIGLLPQLLR